MPDAVPSYLILPRGYVILCLPEFSLMGQVMSLFWESFSND